MARVLSKKQRELRVTIHDQGKPPQRFALRISICGISASETGYPARRLDLKEVIQAVAEKGCIV